MKFKKQLKLKPFEVAVSWSSFLSAANDWFRKDLFHSHKLKLKKTHDATKWCLGKKVLRKFIWDLTPHPSTFFSLSNLVSLCVSLFPLSFSVCFFYLRSKLSVHFLMQDTYHLPFVAKRYKSHGRTRSLPPWKFCFSI